MFWKALDGKLIRYKYLELFQENVNFISIYRHQIQNSRYIVDLIISKKISKHFFNNVGKEGNFPFYSIKFIVQMA